MEVVLGVLMFTFVILSLVIILMFARSKLVSGGQVKIVINDDESKAVQVTDWQYLAQCTGCSKDLYPISMWWKR